MATGNLILSNRFDVLYDNITSSQAPGLDENEKSVFFNKAMLEVLKNKLNPKGNKYGEGFDASSKRQLEFSGLVVEDTLTQEGTAEFCHNGKRFNFSAESSPLDGMLSILNEHVNLNGRTVPVVPLSHVEYDTLMSRPYQRPPRAQAWRLFVNGHIEVVLGVPDPVDSVEYHVRYIRTPEEVDFSQTDGSCELPDFLTDEVLQRAVELAKAAYVGDMNQQQIIQGLGERSE